LSFHIGRKSRGFWVQQPDAVISQANPVSTTLYPVLATNYRVRIITMNAAITWAVTQPTPLVCRVKWAREDF